MASYSTPHLPISAWAEDDRPREKLLLKGASTLSDAELLAILIGSGSRNESAVNLTRRILEQYQHNLNDLGRASLADLTAFKGIGQAKAITLLAAMEVGRRRQHKEARALPSIGKSDDAYQLLRAKVADLDHEQFWLILLNRGHQVLHLEQVSAGGVSGTVVDPKIIFRRALHGQASSIILCHNHPSGNTRPSPSDLEITKKLKLAGQQLEIPVIDHLIVTHRGYFSFADEGLL
ncbi:MAG: DNA repair protein RadC [Saprospiraceae bacterium]|nr:DNA repair protein RadC [Saprospiraceae bacterium]